MDPNAVMRRISEALDDDDQEEAREARATLRGWLGAGGFEPDWKRYPAATKFVRANRSPRTSNNGADADDAEQEAIDERERNAGTGHQRHPGPSTPISDRMAADSPNQHRLIAQWQDAQGRPLEEYAYNLVDLSERLRGAGYSGPMLIAYDTDDRRIVGWVNHETWSRR